MLLCSGISFGRRRGELLVHPRGIPRLASVPQEGLLSRDTLMEKLEKNAKIFDELDDEVVLRAMRK